MTTEYIGLQEKHNPVTVIRNTGQEPARKPMMMKLRSIVLQAVISKIILLSIFVSSFSVSAQHENGERLRLTTTAGYAIENLRWSIAGTNAYGENVDIRSELEWRNVSGINMALEAEWFFTKGFFARANLSGTLITSGTVSDSDFNKNNRQDRTFHDVFDAARGRVTNYQAALGYEFIVLKKHMFRFYTGYGWDSQLLYMLRDLGNIQGDLLSTYQTSWSGFIIGTSFRIYIQKNMFVTGKLTYSPLRYSAEANWNLVNDFQHPLSFEHKAKGYSIGAGIGFGYVVTTRLCAMLSLEHAYAVTGAGTDRLFYKTGNTAVTRLNEVERKNYIVSAGVQLRW